MDNSMLISLITLMKQANFLKDKLTQEEIDNLNKPIPIKEIEPVINNLLKQKTPGLDGFTGEFYYIFKEKIKPILCNLTLILIPDKNNRSKKLQTNISPEQKHKNPQQNTSKSNIKNV